MKNLFLIEGDLWLLCKTVAFGKYRLEYTELKESCVDDLFSNGSEKY